MAEPTATVKIRNAGRWKEPLVGFKPDLDIASLTKKLREKRGGVAYFRHLTVEREIRICVRYLIDEDSRLVKMAQEIRTRPANLRAMFAEYGVDIRNRTLTTAVENQFSTES